MDTYVGESLTRSEDERLLRGQGRYVDDIQLPDMLYAAVLRSVHAHARIRSIDASAARAMPGDEAVLTGDDVAGLVKDIPPIPREGVDQTNAPAHPVLARRKVHYVGQPVAVAVAGDRYRARDALDLIRVEYEPLPPIVDPMAAAEEHSAPIHDVLGTNVAMRLRTGKGDMQACFNAADLVVRARVEVPRLAAVPMEARGLVAHYQAEDQSLTMWTSTQVPHRVRDHLADLIVPPPTRIRVIAPDVGGGFGQKAEVWPEELVVSYLAMQLGRPVKWIEERSENMLAYHGRGYIGDVEAAVRRDGTILGMRFRLVADLGAYYLTFTAAPPSNVVQRVAGPYAIANMEVECLGVITNKPPTGPYRGAGGPEAALFTERTVDLIAGELGLDPAEVRKRNFIPPRAFPYTTATGLTYDSGDFGAAFDRALELAEYDKVRQEQRAKRSPGPLIGVGVATVVKASGGKGHTRSANAEVQIEPTAHVTIRTELSPHGQGTATTLAQIAADQLGVHPEDVIVLHGDTETGPAGHGTFATRGLAVGGSAVYVALQEARSKMIRIASRSLGCPAEDVVLNDRKAFSRREPELAVSLAEVAATAHRPHALPEGMAPGLEFSVSYALANNPFAFAAHVAVVRVDRETGEVAIERYVAVHDCGPMINPMIVGGQIHGGVTQGIGQALSEAMIYDPDGQPLTASLMSYGVPVAEHTPRFILDNLQTPSPTNPMGIRGIGELPTVASPVAIANAVLDALAETGVRHVDLPLTPEKIWQVLSGGHRSPR